MEAALSTACGPSFPSWPQVRLPGQECDCALNLSMPSFPELTFAFFCKCDTSRYDGILNSTWDLAYYTKARCPQTTNILVSITRSA